jgi:hypothetical protein
MELETLLGFKLCCDFSQWQPTFDAILECEDNNIAALHAVDRMETKVMALHTRRNKYID